MSLAIVTFTLTREQLEAIRAKLQAKNVNLVGDKGGVSYSGVQLTFDYVEPTLTITLVDCGRYPQFMIKGRIEDWFKTENSESERTVANEL